jgi:hypothetical protein
MKINRKEYFLLGILIITVILSFLYQRNQRSKNLGKSIRAIEGKVEKHSIEEARPPSPRGELLHRLGQNQKSNLIKSANEKEEAEKRRLEEWKTNFPYKPTYRTDFKFDPERYDPNNPATFRKDPAMRRAIRDHGFMTSFFNNPQIYSAEFEQLYHLLTEVDRAENPKITALIFTQLLDYHKINAKYDLNELWSKEELVPSDDGLGSMVEKMVPIDGKTTWGEKAYEHIASIVGLLVRPKHWPDKPLLDADEARAFRDRLVTEIPSENFVEMPYVIYLDNNQIGAFGYDGHIEKSLKSGDPLLMTVPN